MAELDLLAARSPLVHDAWVDHEAGAMQLLVAFLPKKDALPGEAPYMLLGIGNEALDREGEAAGGIKRSSTICAIIRLARPTIPIA
jgi:hypothetical protein